MATKRRIYWARIVDGPHACSPGGMPGQLSYFCGLSLAPGQRFVLTLGESGSTPAGALVEAHEYIVPDWPATVRESGTGIARGTVPRTWATVDAPLEIRHVGRVGDRPFAPATMHGNPKMPAPYSVESERDETRRVSLSKNLRSSRKPVND